MIEMHAHQYTLGGKRSTGGMNMVDRPAEADGQVAHLFPWHSVTANFFV